MSKHFTLTPAERKPDIPEAERKRIIQDLMPLVIALADIAAAEDEARERDEARRDLR